MILTGGFWCGTGDFLGIWLGYFGTKWKRGGGVQNLGCFGNHHYHLSYPRPLCNLPAFVKPLSKFTNNPIFSTIGMLQSKGTTIRLGQRQKSNSFSILGVAYITRHSLVKSIGEGRKKRQMGA